METTKEQDEHGVDQGKSRPRKILMLLPWVISKGIVFQPLILGLITTYSPMVWPKFKLSTYDLKISSN